MVLECYSINKYEERVQCTQEIVAEGLSQVVCRNCYKHFRKLDTVRHEVHSYDKVIIWFAVLLVVL